MNAWEAARDRLRGVVSTLDGEALCATYTRDIDGWILDALTTALSELPGGGRTDALPPGWALMAIGGTGRRAMSLRSDVDIQLIYAEGAPPPEAFARALFQPLLGLGLRLGHGVRTVAEALALAESDLAFATASVDARHLAGDPNITEAVRVPVFRRLVGPGFPELLDALTADRALRAERMGDTVFVLEPDLKYGIGGLRDAQIINWVSRFTGRPEDPVVIEARGDLYRLRMALHITARVQGNRLAIPIQEAVGRLLGLGEHEGDDPGVAAVQAVHQAAATLSMHARRALTFARAGVRTAVRDDVPGHPTLNRVDGYLTRADGTPPQSVSDLRQTLDAVLDTDLDVGPRIEDALTAWRPQDPEGEAALHEFLMDALCSPRRGAGRALRVMARTGLLEHAIPEFAAIVGRVQRDLYHCYTVDEHTLRVLERLKAIARGAVPFAVLGPELAAAAIEPALCLAALLHDIGKGFGPGHHRRGAAIGREVATRFGMTPEDIRRVEMLIQHQADLAMLCTQRDLSDPRPARQIARLTGTREGLARLTALTLADWSSVGPDAFNTWHQSLLETLVRHADEALDAPEAFEGARVEAEALHRALLIAEFGQLPETPGADTRPIDEFCAALPSRYFLGANIAETQADFALWRRAQGSDGPHYELRPTPDATHAILRVVARDGLGRLAEIAGGIAATGFAVLEADLFRLDGGLVLDRFMLSDPHGRLQNPAAAERVCNAIASGVADPGDADRQIEERVAGQQQPMLPDIATEVRTSTDIARHVAIIDITCGDRPGLLRDIAALLAQLGHSVTVARIHTEGRMARDSFYIQSIEGVMLDEEALVRARAALHECCEGVGEGIAP